MADEDPKTVADVHVAVQSDLPFWQVPWVFAVHGIVGTSIFSIIAAFAVALDPSVHWLETYPISAFVIMGLQVAAYALFVTDLGLFVVFLWRTARRTVKDLW
jgi:hypothetical protein